MALIRAEGLIAMAVACACGGPAGTAESSESMETSRPPVAITAEPVAEPANAVVEGVAVDSPDPEMPSPPQIVGRGYSASGAVDRSMVETWHVVEAPELSLAGVGSGQGELFFGVLGLARFDDGRIAVGDRGQRILVLDETGRLVNTIGSAGAGPGEFVALTRMQRVGGDVLFTYDRSLQRASVFRMDGELLRTVGATCCPVANFVGMLEDGTVVSTRTTTSALGSASTRDTPQIARGTVNLTRHGTEGDPLRSLGVFPGNENLVVPGYPVFAASDQSVLRRLLVLIGPGEIYVATGDAFEVTVLDPDGNILRVLRRDHDPAPLELHDILGPATRSILSTNELRGLTADRTLPAIRTLLRDDLGNLWVEEFSADFDHPSAWSIFDPRGRLIAGGVLPERFRAFHVGDDFVLGVWRDDLDVEFVQLHRLVKDPS